MLTRILRRTAPAILILVLVFAVTSSAILPKAHAIKIKRPYVDPNCAKVWSALTKQGAKLGGPVGAGVGSFLGAMWCLIPGAI